MKIACLTLLLANLLFFGWSRWVAQPDLPPVADSSSASLPQLDLVNETAERAEPLPAAEEGSPDTLATQEDPNALRCSSIGPFQDVTAANQAATALRGKGYGLKVRVVEGDLRAGLWVHLENLTAKEAQQSMTLLKQRGIADAYLMPSQEISLGIFSESPRAQRRAEEVRALGLKPTVTDRRKGASYWLDVDLKPGDKPLDPAAIQNGSDKTGSIVRVGIQACPAAEQ